ncbi:MAG TPA: hypothetical protein VND64_25550 [Pirellulales bacterium]|nr:hypothetical protein [Pirellulales bacterium]
MSTHALLVEVGTAPRSGVEGGPSPGANGVARRRVASIVGVYVAAAGLSVLFLARILNLWQADLSVPFDIGSDSLFGQMWVKGIRDHGWYLRNPSLSAPSGLDMRDFPLADSLHFALIKLLSLVTPDFGTAFNLYFVLGFPLTTCTALFVLRRFRVSSAPALSASLLYAFVPYHLFRGENHLFLTSYFVVPFSIMVALWVYQGKVDWTQKSKATNDGGGRGRGIAALVVAILQSSAGVYYAFFACYLLLVAGASAALDGRRLRPLGVAASLVTLTSLGVLANIAPSLAFWHRHGRNPEVARRTADEAEIHGLKIGQLLLPAAQHRVAPWARARVKYDQAPLSDGEKQGSSLGFLGGLGFLFLIGLMLTRRAVSGEWELARGLAVLNLFSVLLATIGGFGSLFSFLVSPMIRGYNRISIVIALLSLFAVALLLERAGQWWTRAGRPRYQFHLLLAALTVLGIIDEAGRGRVPAYAALRASFTNDAEFVARIEAALPHGAMVYQLPYARFPEFVAPHVLREYEHFRPYFHSDSLRWSYGAMKGRAEDLWQRELAARPLEEQVQAIAARGFRGIYIDRHGFVDRAAELESGLGRLLGGGPIESGDGRMSFFRLP